MMMEITTESKLLILTAVAAESDQLISALHQPQTIQCGHLTVYTGLIDSQNLAIACCGIGKAAAAAATVLLINKFTLSHVLMVGCAGAYLEGGLTVGDIAIASDEIMGDEGVLTSNGFLDMEQLGFAIVQCGEQRFFNRFPTTDTMVERFNAVLTPYAQQHSLQCKTGSFVTVSTCSGTALIGQQLYQRTQGIIENMEGAAVAQMCAQYQIPFSELRVISNMVEDRNMDQWDLTGAMTRAQHAALQVIHCFTAEKE
ncbi:MAG: futalosine hydrolase [Desulfobacteraceae bacterium 4572_35.2]|nr:MAG: futalosine hydrolase [Desulfobacteraceae bacterium 4572_35.2]